MATTVVDVRDYPLIDGKRVLPEGVVYVGRAVPRVGLQASRWANRFKPEVPSAGVTSKWLRGLIQRRHLVQYDDWLADELRIDPGFLDPLRGKALACWCKRKKKPCHATVIVTKIEQHPMVPRPGEPIVFGLHRQPEEAAETAPAWPSMGRFAQRFEERHRRAMRKAAAHA